MKTIKLPDIGEGVKEGELKSWLVKAGDQVQVDDVLAEVLTDKAAVEVPSPHAGTVKSLKAKVGDMIPVGGALLEIDTSSTGGASTSASSRTSANAGSSSSSSSSSGVSSIGEATPPKASSTPVLQGQVAQKAVPSHMSTPSVSSSVELADNVSTTSGVATSGVATSGMTTSGVATPSTRRLAREKGLDISQIKGTGLAGRVTREDVLRYQAAPSVAAASSSGQTSWPAHAGMAEAGAASSVALSTGAMPVAPVSAAPLMPAPLMAAPLGGPDKIEYKKTFDTAALDGASVPKQDDTIKALQGVRRKIAQHLQRTKQVVPHFTIYNEANVEKLISLRDDLRATHKVKITYLPFIMKSLAGVLREHPHCNASIDDENIIYKAQQHVGFACDAPDGLLVPVVRHVGEQSVLQLHNEVVRLADKARVGKATRDELQGATVSITNIGSIGGLMGTPIINHPEVLILGVYNVVVRPQWQGVQWVPQRVMGFTVTCDHRLIDGAAAAKFLNAFVHSIEHPASLLV